LISHFQFSFRRASFSIHSSFVFHIFSARFLSSLDLNPPPEHPSFLLIKNFQFVFSTDGGKSSKPLPEDVLQELKKTLCENSLAVGLPLAREAMQTYFSTTHPDQASLSSSSSQDEEMEEDGTSS
jgi:hypothetical protein